MPGWDCSTNPCMEIEFLIMSYQVYEPPNVSLTDYIFQVHQSKESAEVNSVFLQKYGDF